MRLGAGGKVAPDLADKILTQGKPFNLANKK